jgi:hypothetical protein
MALQSRSEHTFSWWHQGVFLYDRAYVWSEDHREYTEAASGEWLDQSTSGGVTYVSPGGSAFTAENVPLTVEVHDTPPPAPPDDAESIGEFDLILPSGELAMEESGGGSDDNVLALPDGEWRARWSGFGEAAADELDEVEIDKSTERPDRYLLQLWPRSEPAGVASIRSVRDSWP